MTVVLTEAQEIMVRIMASEIRGAGQNDFVDSVKTRLEGEGKPINTQIVRAAATRELMRRSDEADVSVGGGAGEGEIAFLGFKTGAYRIGGAVSSLGAICEQNLGWGNFDQSAIVDGVGLVGASNSFPALTSAVVTSLLEHGFTALFTFIASNEEEEIAQCDIVVLEFPNYAVYWEANFINYYEVEEDRSFYITPLLSQTSFASVVPGLNKLAVTLDGSKISLCLNGAPVITASDATSLSLANSIWLQSSFGIIEDATFLGPRPDENLPTMTAI